MHPIILLMYLAPIYVLACWPIGIYVYKRKIANNPLVIRIAFDLFLVVSFLAALLLSVVSYLSLTVPNW